MLVLLYGEEILATLNLVPYNVLFVFSCLALADLLLLKLNCALL